MSILEFSPTLKVFIPRQDRDLARGMRARDAAYLADGGASPKQMAMIAAKANIGAAFNTTSTLHNDMKRQVERMIALGATHPAVQSRYSKLTPALVECSDINQALALLDQWRAEAKRGLANPWANKSGHGWRLRLASELRLILRMMRRYRRAYVMAA